MEHEKILRINELAKKKKEVGLTDEEAEERKTLHAQYIKEFREQTEATLKRVRVEQDDGSYKPLEEREEAELNKCGVSFAKRKERRFLCRKR